MRSRTRGRPPRPRFPSAKATGGVNKSPSRSAPPVAGQPSVMTARTYPPPDAPLAGSNPDSETPGRGEAEDVPSDDRITTPPPFDVEAFARRTATSEVDLSSISGLAASLGTPATAPPLAVTKAPSRAPRTARTRRSFGAMVSVTALAVAAVGVVGGVDGRSLRSASPAKSVAVSLASPPPSSPPASPPPSPPAPAEAPDLPVALTVVRPPAVPNAPKPPALQPAPAQQAPPRSKPTATPSPPPECQPPYVIDALTGKKRWKLDCL
jgi:hypothetical protein